MNRKHIIQKTTLAAVLAAVGLGMSGVAWADRDDHRNNNDRRDRHDQRYDRRSYNDHDRWGHRVDTRRGYGPDRRYYIGHTLPREYRRNTYVVEDWRGHRLYAPPRGYHWVQSGSDYLLVAVATGLIASAIMNGN